MSLGIELYYKGKDEYKLEGKELSDFVENGVRERAKELMAELIDLTNASGSEIPVKEGILEGIHTSHRALQSNFWDIMVKVVTEYTQSDRFDARNEWCKNLTARWNAVTYATVYGLDELVRRIKS